MSIGSDYFANVSTFKAIEILKRRIEKMKSIKEKKNKKEKSGNDFGKILQDDDGTFKIFEEYQDED